MLFILVPLESLHSLSMMDRMAIGMLEIFYTTSEISKGRKIILTSSLSLSVPETWLLERNVGMKPNVGHTINTLCRRIRYKSELVCSYTLVE